MTSPQQPDVPVPSGFLFGAKDGGHQVYMRSWEKYPGREAVPFETLCADYRQQYQNGCRQFIFYSTCASDFYVPELEVWRAPEAWDYGHLDRFMAFFKEECPEARVIPQVYVGAPTWWEEKYPDELTRFANGATEAAYSAASGSTRRRVASFASERWAIDMADALARYLDYCESRYGALIDAYFICSGITYEWGIPGSFDFVDYSQPMQAYWQRWQEQNLRMPRGQTLPIPTSGERLAAVGSYRDPSRSQAAMDFQLCLSDLVAERILQFCGIVKAKTRKPTIVYYGFTLTAREGGLEFQGRYGCGGFQGGHLALHRVLDSELVDVITSPFSYNNRRLGTGDVEAHYPWTSVTRAGKISWLQDDNRSWRGYPATGLDVGHYADRASFILLLRRNFAKRLCGLDQIYLMDLLGGNYDDPMVLEEMRRLAALYERFAPWRRALQADVLLVVDEESITGLSLTSSLHQQNIYQQLPEWSHSGLTYDVVLLGDARKMDLKRYSLVVLCNAVLYTAELQDFVDACRTVGSSLLFMPGVGLVGPEGPAAAWAERLSGVRLKVVVEPPGVMRAIWHDGAERQEFGYDKPLSHRLSGSAGESWAELPQELGSALAINFRPQGGFEAYATVAPIPALLLGKLGEAAGCHRANDQGQWTLIAPHFIALHACRSGEHLIRCRQLPGVVEPVLPPSEWRVVGNDLHLTLAEHETALFHVQ